MNDFSLDQVERYGKVLKDGCKSLQIELDNTKFEAFIAYLSLFHKWNRSYNLSAIRDPDEMPTRHILDSLSVLPYVRASHTLDVGTGPGLPGIPLAIALPEQKFTLLDSNGKKTRFLFQVVQALGLKNVYIENRRVESWKPEPFEAVICRAYSSVPGIIETCAHLVASEGKIFAMKGLIPRDELREVEKHYIVEAVHELHVPGLDGERNLIVLNRREKTKKIEISKT